MKKFIAILTVALLCVAMAVPAFAADDITSPENNVNDIVISAVDADGVNVKPQTNAVIDETTDDAKKELSGDGAIKDVIGKPADTKYTLTNVVNIDFPENAKFPVDVKVAVTGAKAGDKAYVLYKTADGWTVLEAKAEKGAISFAAAADGVYAFVLDAAGSASAPSTGYAGIVAMVSVLGLISLAGAAFAAKRCF